MTRKYFYLLFIFFIFCTDLIAQQDDFRTRTSIELEKDFKKGFDLNLSYEYRTDQNATRFQGSYFTLSPSYKINDYLSTSLAIRYATSTVWDRFRFAYYLTAKNKYNKIMYSFRLGYLHEFYLQELQEINQFPSTDNLRIRLKADRKVIKKVRAHIGVEPVINLNNEISFSQLRNIAGFEWEFSKNNFVNAEWLWQARYSTQYLYSTHSLCLNYLLKF